MEHFLRLRLALIHAATNAPFLTDGERLEIIEEASATGVGHVELEDIFTRWEVRFDGSELTNMRAVEGYDCPQADALREVAKAIVSAERRAA